MRTICAALGLAALILAGCAQDLPTVRWAKPGASFDEFVAAHDSCADEARRESQPFYLGGEHYAGRPDAVESGLFIPCMAERGWHRDPKGFAAPEDDRFALWP